jgi:hypothetical protein
VLVRTNRIQRISVIVLTFPAFLSVMHDAISDRAVVYLCECGGLSPVWQCRAKSRWFYIWSLRWLSPVSLIYICQCGGFISVHRGGYLRVIVVVISGYGMICGGYLRFLGWWLSPVCGGYLRFLLCKSFSVVLYLLVDCSAVVISLFIVVVISG